MAKDKKSVVIYVDWIDTFESLQDDEAGKLIKHLFRYVNDLNPEAPDRLIGLMFEPLKATLKRDLKRYEARCKQNAKNAEVRWALEHGNVCDRMRTDAKHADSDSDSDSGIDK